LAIWWLIMMTPSEVGIAHQGRTPSLSGKWSSSRNGWSMKIYIINILHGSDPHNPPNEPYHAKSHIWTFCYNSEEDFNVQALVNT
jgi:hypothetical protein